MQTFKCYFDSMRKDAVAYPPASRSGPSRRHCRLTDAILVAILFIAVGLSTGQTVEAIVIARGEIPSSTARPKTRNDSQINIESNLIETSSEDEYKSFFKKTTTQSASKSKLLLRKNHLNIYSNTGADEVEDQKIVANLKDEMDDIAEFSHLTKYTTLMPESVTSLTEDETPVDGLIHLKSIHNINTPIIKDKHQDDDFKMNYGSTVKTEIFNIEENVKNKSHSNEGDFNMKNLFRNETDAPETTTSVSVTTDSIIKGNKPTTNRVFIVRETTTEKAPSLLDFMGRILYEFDLSRSDEGQTGSPNRTENRTHHSNDTHSDDKLYSEIREIEGLKPEEDDTQEYDLLTDGGGSSSTAATATETASPLTALWEVAETVAGSVMEMILPKGLRDLMKRMQKQNELLETERLRGREENGGIGQLGRSIIKGVSSGIVEPLVRGVKDIGSLDTDNNFFAGVVNGVTSMANEVMDTFKEKVKVIYPGTLWCGDGHLALEARSLGVFARTDTCCRRHDACSAHIPAGGTRHNLTNTGIFTRSHCGCDRAFRDCLRRLNTPISAQIGFTYFTVLGPQCFRFAHPIVRCARKTRITGQKCEEYELDHSKPKMWQWFDNETF